jgi:hypothetical protein
MDSVITPASSAVDPGSLRDRLRAAKAEQQANTYHELAIPGFSGQLVARYRVVDWSERRNIGLSVKGPSIAARELEAAADILIASCVGVFAHVDGQVAELGQKMGMSLAHFLGEEAAETDRQGVFLIFPSELALMSHVEKLSELQSASTEEADNVIAGN